MADNEPIYDEQIFPLMERIIAICKAHQLPMFATFQLTPHPEDEDGRQTLWATTALRHGGGEGVSPLIDELVERAYQQSPPVFSFMITTPTPPGGEP